MSRSPANDYCKFIHCVPLSSPSYHHRTHYKQSILKQWGNDGKSWNNWQTFFQTNFQFYIQRYRKLAFERLIRWRMSVLSSFEKRNEKINNHSSHVNYSMIHNNFPVISAGSKSRPVFLGSVVRTLTVATTISLPKTTDLAGKFNVELVLRQKHIVNKLGSSHSFHLKCAKNGAWLFIDDFIHIWLCILCHC